jgi:ribonuclease E
MSTAPRKRRRRGGRGRGRKPAQTADATPETTDPDGVPAETPKPRAPRARKEATAGAEGEAAEPKPAPKPRAPRSRSAAVREPAEGQAPTSATTPPEGETVEEADGATPPRKRRRRGGRGRGKKKTAQPVEGEESSSSDARPPAAPRARRAAASQPRDESQVSTRLRRTRQTRQTRSTSRRRREPLPVVPRVTDKLMAITEHGERDQIAVLEGRDLVQHYVTRIGAHSMVGNVYLGRVQNVLPGMEAAFIDVGRGRNAVLYAGEVNYSPEDLEGSPPRIEKVLKNGQSVLVQVTKDPIGGKGARLTAQISMPGRYLVLVPSSTVTGISRRLGEEERKRLKAIYKKIKPDPHGLIVRTAAEGASEEALAADLGRLLEEWTAIEKRAKKAKAPAVLYEEPELTVRVVRDLFTDEEYRELVTDSPRVYEIVTDYLRQADPEVVGKVRLHEGRLPVFEEFHIVEQIHKGLDRKVWLPSGGYIVIDRTEALTVIDVNTGKSVGKTNLEETVVNTNLEAAREVARQLRLRDIGGMIVIDMIDMLLEQNKKKVIETLRESLAQDKSRSQVFDISPLGLLEVTRKRVSGGLLESFSETCPTCEGRGVLLTYDVN